MSRSEAVLPGRAWAELLRLPALFTEPGDILAGAAATGTHPLVPPPGEPSATPEGSTPCTPRTP